MAFQVLQDPSRGAIGEAIGSAVSTGIQSLVQHKLGQIQEHKQRQDTVRGLQALGYSPKEATELSHFDPQIIGEIAKRKLAEPGEQAYANALGSLLGGQPQVQAAQQQQELPQAQSNALPSIEKLSPKQKEQLKQYLASPKAPKVYSPEVLNRIRESLEPKAAIAPKAVEQPKAPSLKGLNARQAEKLIEFGLKKQQLTEKQQAEINKQEKPFVNETLKEEKGAKDSDRRLNRMEALVKHGKLPNPVAYKLFKSLEEAKTGIPFIGGLVDLVVNNIGSTLSTVQRDVTAPDTQEYEKLVADFFRSAKDIFGSRVTNFDLETFAKMLPTLANTDSGKLAIIENMKAANKVSYAKAKATKDIIRENGGKIPQNLQLMVDDRISPLLDQFAEDFKSGFQHLK